MAEPTSAPLQSLTLLCPQLEKLQDDVQKALKLQGDVQKVLVRLDKLEEAAEGDELQRVVQSRVEEHTAVLRAKGLLAFPEEVKAAKDLEEKRGNTLADVEARLTVQEKKLQDDVKALQASFEAFNAFKEKYDKALAEVQEGLLKASTPDPDGKIISQALDTLRKDVDKCKEDVGLLDKKCQDSRLDDLRKEIKLVREDQAPPQSLAIDQVNMAFSAAMKADTIAADLEALKFRVRAVEGFLHERLSGLPQGPAHHAVPRLPRARSSDPADAARQYCAGRVRAAAGRVPSRA